MKKNDILLIAAVIVIAFVFLGYQLWRTDSNGEMVIVTVDGAEYGRYHLDTAQTIDIEGVTKMEINNHKADIIDADCPDKLCVHQRSISRDGESIICLPNQVIVTIEGGRQKELDAVTN